jgi:hypothetical protein
LSEARNPAADNGIGAHTPPSTRSGGIRQTTAWLPPGAGNHLRLKSWKSAIVRTAVNPRRMQIKGVERQ